MVRQILTALIVSIFVGVGVWALAYHAGEVHEVRCMEQIGC